MTNGILRQSGTGPDAHYTLSFAPPNLRHAERLAATGAISTIDRQARATKRSLIIRERIAAILLVLAAIAALIIFGGK